ncbi:MAG: prepilin-type N-terminal cleavage/methylation domain-containing protein [Candidatus Woesebacteria bacterium]|jgi:prepilin-type N-terminal cleavage/methylation domain-containing protein
MTALKNKGFTLIELLIVMAVLGVLAVVVLVAINPVQQLAKTRDAGRKSGVTQIGHALEAYYTSQGGQYPADGSTAWATDLTDSGDLSIVPSLITNSINSVCTTTGQTNGWCYDTQGQTQSVVFSRLESDAEIESKCNGTPTNAYFVWSTADGRAGLVCSPTEPTAAGVTFTD